jgi:integrase
MAPRQRKDINRGLPDHTRCRGGYYSWRHPETREEFGLGRDRTAAIKEAIRANALIASKTPSLVERITGAVMTWGRWCDEFEKILAERERKPNTARAHAGYMKRLRSCFDERRAAKSITTADCSKAVEALKAKGRHRTAQAFRSFLIDCFDRMIAKGERTDNPARVLDEVKVKVKRARLTLEAFMALYRTTSIVWLRNAMALAIVGGQDRDSCRNARFTDFRDGGWWNERSKTGARVFLPLEIRLDCFGMSLADVLKQCRSTGIVSHYLIHQTQRIRGATLGKPLHVDMITRVFSWELKKLGLDWGGKNPPSFHEIRSLAARLHKAQGNINPQELLSHKDPRTTAIYTDGRGEWVKVGIKP